MAAAGDLGGIVETGGFWALAAFGAITGVDAGNDEVETCFAVVASV